MQLDYSYVDCHQLCKAPTSAVIPVAKNATKLRITHTFIFVALVVNK
jgi:hypothetical protein